MTYVDHYKGERKQDWRTPEAMFGDLHKRFRFSLDGAATQDNALLMAFDGGGVSWEGHRVFCNPPWSGIAPFIEKAATADLAVLLVPARVNARWFHRALELGARVEYFLGKPRFRGAQWNSPVDCLLLVWE